MIKPAQIEAIQKELDHCLEKFPELEDVELVIEESPALSGACGRRGNSRVVILLTPLRLLDHPDIFRPIIYHELSHMINMENPDEVFFARADEQSKQLWKLLEGVSALHCEVVQADDKTAIYSPV